MKMYLNHVKGNINVACACVYPDLFLKQDITVIINHNLVLRNDVDVDKNYIIICALHQS